MPKIFQISAQVYNTDFVKLIFAYKNFTFFLLFYRLNAHIETHQEISTRPRPYQCLECDKNFLRSSDLWSHQRIHSGSKYTCLQCGKKLGM